MQSFRFSFSNLWRSQDVTWGLEKSQDLTSGLQVVSAKVEQARDKAEAYRGPQFNKDRCFTLLVIDDQNTDW